METTYELFLTRIIDEGIEDAKASYKTDDLKQRGAIAGFEACREKQPAALLDLLRKSARRTRDALMPYGSVDPADDYWYHRCFEAEVDWVCNCVSAFLQMIHHPTIVEPTYRGLRKALSIVNPGVLEAFEADRDAKGLHNLERKYH